MRIARIASRTGRHHVVGGTDGWLEVALDEKMTQAEHGDGFTPLGPWIETDLDPSSLPITVRVNGRHRAGASTADLARNITEQLVYLTSHLRPRARGRRAHRRSRHLHGDQARRPRRDRDRRDRCTVQPGACVEPGWCPVTSAAHAPGTGLFDLTGRLAVVTGSSRGIGLAIAAGLAAAGARVVLNGVDGARLDRTPDALRDRFGPEAVHALRFDVTDPDQIQTAVADIEGRLGPIEVLVNNAGLQHRQALLDVSLDGWNRVLQVNLTSAFLIGREVARYQLARGSGKIINICSVQTDLARPSIAPYTAAKGG